ncbi:MAG: AI-2E family transporter [Bryobacteraceae bacterium]|nr:AI-2E family transporter [Bryobacteraceae bacterium]
MLGIETKAVRYTWSVVVTLAAVAFLYQVRLALLIFVLAIFFAYMMAPVVSLIDRFHQGRISRSLTLGLVYMALLALIVAGIAAVAGRASQEAANLIGRLPELAESAGKLSRTPLPSWLEPFRGEILDLLQQQVQGGLERFLPMLRSTLGHVLSAIGNIGFVVLVPILSFFFLKDAGEIRGWLLDTARRMGRLEFVEGLSGEIHQMLGLYIRALALLSAATFVAYELFFSFAGVPYRSLLATIAAVLEFIPVVGPLTAAVVACVVALVSGYQHVVAMVVFFLLFRLFQDYVLQPILYSSGIELHPLLVMFGALAGEEIGGITGMVLSVPVLATLRLIWYRALGGRE